MTVKQIKQIVRKHADINKVVTEDYENEACEIIVYDPIYDYNYYTIITINSGA